MEAAEQYNQESAIQFNPNEEPSVFASKPIESFRHGFWTTVDTIKIETSNLGRNLETLISPKTTEIGRSLESFIAPKTDQVAQTTRAIGETLENRLTSLKDKTIEFVTGQKSLTSVLTIALGVTQDGGYPRLGCSLPCCKGITSHNYISSLAVVDIITSESWIFDATHDFKDQIQLLEHLQAPDVRHWSATINNAPQDKSLITGIFLTHANPAHYAGLLQLGREGANLKNIPVYCLPKLAEFLKKNAPWNNLIQNGNIVLKELKDQERVSVNWRIHVTPITVPSRDEHSESVGYLIEGPEKTVVYIPDVESWEKESPSASLVPSGTSLTSRRVDNASGSDATTSSSSSSSAKVPEDVPEPKTNANAAKKDEPASEKKKYSLEELILMSDYTLLDGTFFSAEEHTSGVIDPEQAPHPSIHDTTAYLRRLPDEDKQKVHFIHFDHTNPVVWEVNNYAKNYVTEKGHRFVTQGQKFYL